jgi:hypothetical protein
VFDLKDHKLGDKTSNREKQRELGVTDDREGAWE